MALTTVFSVLVLGTWVHGSKLISQHEGGSPSQKPQTQSPEDILKHALLKKDLDREISEWTKKVSQRKTEKAQKKSAHESAVQEEHDALKAESQAVDSEAQAREKKEQAQSTKSAAQQNVEILEGKTSAIEDVEAATEDLNTARSRLASAKSARTKHLADVKKAGEAQTLAETRKTNAEAAENQASLVATQAAMDQQNKVVHHTFAQTMYESAKSGGMPQYLLDMYKMGMDQAKKAKDAADAAKKDADDAWAAAKQEEEDAVAALTEAKQNKIDLDKLTSNFQAAVDDAETKRAVALIALDRAMEAAHKHFTSKEEIEGAKSEELRRQVEQAKTELQAAQTAFNQAKAKADKAAEDLEKAEQATQEATQKKMAAKHELEQARLRLELARGKLRDAKSELENAKKDAREQLAAAKAAEAQAQTELNQATQRYTSHTQAVSDASKAHEDAQKKYDDADAHHASKVACHAASVQATNEANAFRTQAQYWSAHTEILEKEHYWDAEFGPIHQSADTILEDKKGDYQDAKSKSDKHEKDVQTALAAKEAAGKVRVEASEALSNLEAKTELFQEKVTEAAGRKNAATYRREVAEAIHKVYHK